jgi:hypothetical protein
MGLFTHGTGAPLALISEVETRYRRTDMRLIGRRPKIDESQGRETCPICSEPVPEGAVECTMCGSVLRVRGGNGGKRPLDTAPARTA